MIAELPGARIWYEERGSGVPVVLLHAGSGSSLMWEKQLDAFAAAGHRAIAYDRRGHGRTEADAGGPAASAADDLQRLADALGLERLHLVGTAAGGIVAFDFALSFAGRLRSLVVANSIGGAQDEDYVALQRRLRPAPQFGALPAHVRELGPVYRAADPEGEARWIALEERSFPRGGGMPKLALRNRITFSALESLAVPTLLLTGDADLYAPPPVMQLYQARLRRSQALVLPECGHSAYWEQPALFNRAILDFLKSVPGT